MATPSFPFRFGWCALARTPWLLPVLLVALISCGAVLRCFFGPTVYEAHGIVECREAEMDATDWRTNLAAAVKDPQTIERTAKKLGLTGSARELTSGRGAGLQTVFETPSDNGVTFRVRASTAALANQWMPALWEESGSAQTSIAAGSQAPIAIAMFGSARRISPVIRQVVTGALLLALLSMILARITVPFVLPHFTSCDQLESRFRVPCLGLLPQLTARPTEDADHTTDSAAALEEFSCEGALVPIAQDEQLGRVIIVTGAGSGVGKTFVAALLARACLKENLNTLLIDAGATSDVHRLFGLRPGPGLSEYVAGAATIERICRKPHLSRLRVITGGSDSCTKRGARLQQLFETVLPEVTAAFDRIIVDAGCVHDWPARLPNLDQCAVAVVVPSAGSFAPATAKALRFLSRKHARFCGCIINGLELSAPVLTLARGAGEHAGWAVPVAG